MGIANDPSLVEALFKANSGAKDFSSTQFGQLLYYHVALFGTYEDSFIQHRDGLLSDRDFGSVINSIAANFQRAAGRLMWKTYLRATYENEFAAFMDTLLAKTPVTPFAFVLTDWLHNWTDETAPIGRLPNAPATDQA
jgi:hypothetical protein